MKCILCLSHESDLQKTNDDYTIPPTCTPKKWKNKVTLPTTSAFQGNPKWYIGFHYLESFKTSRPADGKELCLCSWRSTVPVPKHHIQSWSYDDRHRSAVAFQMATTACCTCSHAITTIPWMHSPAKYFAEWMGINSDNFTTKGLEFVTTQLKEHINKPWVCMKSVRVWPSMGDSGPKIGYLVTYHPIVNYSV